MARAKYTLFTVILALILSFHSSDCLDNDLARTPPMGWISKERFGCDVDCVSNQNDCISSRLFEQMADRLVSDNYTQVGYEYIQLDDCWSARERLWDGYSYRLTASANFPSGIHELARYLHGKGLKIGIQGDCGTRTCQGYPGQLKEGTTQSLEDNYFELDANVFSDWTVDAFKFDGCNIDPSKFESICPLMSSALNATQRPILINCEWPHHMLRQLGSSSLVSDYGRVQSSCNTWRYYEDIEDSWLSVLSIVDHTVKMQETILKYHGPGNWFDPDQLIIGNFGLSLNQAKAQMALWSIWAAPLYMSSDLRGIERDMGKVLKNKNLIDVNQDKLGVFGLMVAEQDEGLIQAFVKPVEIIKNDCPSFAIVYLNRNTLGSAKKVSFNLRDLLRKSALGTAARRYHEFYSKFKPGGGLSAEKCRNRLIKAMTRDPRTIPPQLLVQPASGETTTPIEEQTVDYYVFDLLQGRTVGSASLNGTLTLFVPPSGVQAVKLTERKKK